MIIKIRKDLEGLKDLEKAEILQRFFKTWVWEYWEGDIFIWITVPELRNIAKKYYKETDFLVIKELLTSKIHEERFLALAILRVKYEKIKEELGKKEIFDFTLQNLKYINNWDLVDVYIPYVVWDYLFWKDVSLLFIWASSKNIWERRIAVMSTYSFIKRNKFEDTIKLCEILINDKHDLIHKATWWMLREVWKKDEKVLLNFLDKYYKLMPRTMLRYSIEKLDKNKREYYMKK